MYNNYSGLLTQTLLFTSSDVRYLKGDTTVNSGENVTLTCELTGNSWASGVNIARSSVDSVETIICTVNNTGGGSCNGTRIQVTGSIVDATMTVKMYIDSAACTDSGQYFCSPIDDDTAKALRKMSVISKYIV